VLTQTLPYPVVVLPGTASDPVFPEQRFCQRVMVIADHISGDSRLINYGSRFCSDGGTLWLCHVEDDRVFERYMAATSRIPEIETDQARTLIGDQLLKEARDFIELCLAELQIHRPQLVLESRVQMGHHLQLYRRLVDEHDIDLIVMNTKDEDQLAMHGMAWAIGVEMPETAMLML